MAGNKGEPSGGIRVSGRSQVFGLFGYPVAHSLSPAMHNRGFAALNYPGVYVPFPVEPARLGEAVAGIRALGIGGVNVTVPHKQAIMPFLDEVTPAAQRIGAVNTVIHKDGRLIGDNTDGHGFLRSLREELGIDPRGQTALVLGAGGAARSIAVALLDRGVSRLVIANRTLSKAQQLVQDLASSVSGEAPSSDLAAIALDDPRLEEATREADVLIHTTSWGMAPAHDVPPLIPPQWLQPRTVVCDIVYAPAETSLLREARAKGCPALPGLGMLLYQGVLAFEAWTGVAAPVADMRAALQKHMVEKS